MPEMSALSAAVLYMLLAWIAFFALVVAWRQLGVLHVDAVFGP